MPDVLTNPVSFGGCEWAFFRPRQAVSRDTLVAASRLMKREFLRQQEGFIDHALIENADGTWADVVFADSQAAAEAICSRFMTHEACRAYLELIDPDSVKLTFWHRHA